MSSLETITKSFDYASQTLSSLYELWHFERNEKRGIQPTDDAFAQKVAGIYQMTPHFLTSGIEHFDAWSRIYLEVTDNKASLILTEYHPKAVKIALSLLGMLGFAVARRTTCVLALIALLAIGMIKLLRNAKMCSEIDEKMDDNGEKTTPALARKSYWENKSRELLTIGSGAKTAPTLLEEQFQGVNQVFREALLAKVRAAFFEAVSNGKALRPCSDVYREVSDHENLFRYHQFKPLENQISSNNNRISQQLIFCGFQPRLIQFSDNTGLTPHQVHEMSPEALSEKLEAHFP